MMRTICISIAICLAVNTAIPQEFTVAERLREQAGSIADSAMSKIVHHGVTAVEMLVEGRGARILVPNGFLEAMKGSAIAQRTDAVGTPGWSRLRISIVAQAVHFTAIPDGRSLRTVRSVIEPRLEFSSDDIRLLGVLERQTVDTVQTAVAEQIVDDEMEESAFDRLMIPLIIGASVVLAVYLLFTVRS
jgi:hypothetical protein